MIVGAIAGTVLLGGGYFALNGGTDDFSFSHALMWATGGGFLGGFAFTSAGTAVITALARRLAPKFAQQFYLTLQLGGKGMAARFLAGAWLKNSVVPMGGLFVVELINIGATGELPSARRFASDVVLSLLTAPIGGHFANRAISSFRNKNILNGLLSGTAGINLGGATSFMLGSVGSGSGTWIDYLGGMVTAGMFMRLKPSVDRYLTDKTREIGYEVLQKYSGGQVSNSLKGKPNILNGFQQPTHTHNHTNTQMQYNMNQSIDSGSQVNQLQTENNLTPQEQEALQDYLKNISNVK